MCIRDSGGLVLPEINGGTAPVRFDVDFGDKNNPFLFVADLGKHIESHTARVPGIGDQLLMINGEEIQSYLARAKVYTRHSTNENYLKNMAQNLTRKSQRLPPVFFRDQLSLTLKPKRGKTYSITLPYLENVDWSVGVFVRDYPGYEEVTSFRYESFKLYRPRDKTNKTLVLWLSLIHIS